MTQTAKEYLDDKCFGVTGSSWNEEEVLRMMGGFADLKAREAFEAGFKVGYVYDDLSAEIIDREYRCYLTSKAE